MKSKKLRIALIASAVLLGVLLAVSGGLEIARRACAASLEDQQAAQRWNGSDAAQISCFFAEGAGFDVGRIYSMEKTIDEAITEASLTAASSARLWYHAYSTETTLYGDAARGGVSLTVTVFGGDYFLIHQPALISGGYLTAAGENAGYVFLDENAAWQLFGAIDVSGMSMTLGGSEYIVCGVGAVPSGTLYDEAYGGKPRAWVLFDSPSGKNAGQASVYEAVLPEPIEGFAAGIAEKLFPAGDNTVVVENSERFGYLPLLEHLKNRSTLGVRTSAVTFPWWENIARVTEYRCATLLRLEIVLLACALLLCLVWIGIAWNPAGRALRKGALWLRDEAEETYNALTRKKEKPARKEKKISPKQ